MCVSGPWTYPHFSHDPKNFIAYPQILFAFSVCTQLDLPLLMCDCPMSNNCSASYLAT